MGILGRWLDRREERSAAANYRRMIGMDDPIEVRRERHRKAAEGAPILKWPIEREWCLICGHLMAHHDEDGCFRGDPGAGWDCSCEAINPESLAWDLP